jgi:UDP-N-acetylglucosamine--N-acetylmuramyl-(pentapeptide) pyrophosphoryl-undecaprenol N-acetylglucosamine transferase
LAQQVFQAFPGTWRQGLHAVTCGNPVRQAVAELPPPSVRLAPRSGKPRLLITGGSQGAQALNRALPEPIALLSGAAVPEIRHQAGRGRAGETAAAYAAAGLAAQVDEFIEDIAAAYSWADLVVCRAGALTVSELAAAGLGSILVPFPFAVDDHQTRNAEYLVEAGAASLLPEAACNATALARLLQTLLSDRAGLLRMAQAARTLALPDSAAQVARACMEFAKT